MFAQLRNLHSKIIVPISAALVVVLAAVAIVQWRERQTALVASLEEHTRETSAVVEATLRHAMLKRARPIAPPTRHKETRWRTARS